MPQQIWEPNREGEGSGNGDGKWLCCFLEGVWVRKGLNGSKMPIGVKGLGLLRNQIISVGQLWNLNF